MGQSRCNIFLHSGKSRNGKILSVPAVIILNNLHQTILFVNCPLLIINVRIKQGRHFKFRCHFLEQSIVANRIRNAGCGKNSMKANALVTLSGAEATEILPDIFHHRMGVRILSVLCIRNIVFNSSKIFSAAGINISGHRHLPGIHELHVDLSFIFVVQRLFLRGCMCHFKRNGFAHFLVPICPHHIRIESQNISVANAVCDAVSMQLIAENRCGRALLFLVLLLNRCSGKSKENRLRERFLNADQHIAESGSMGFIHNKNNSLPSNRFQIPGFQSRILRHVAHLLDRCDNQRVCRIRAFQFSNQYPGVFRRLNILIVICKTPIFLQGLGAQLNSVHQKNHLVRIAGIRNQLCRLEAGHGFTGAGGVPHVSTQLILLSPLGLPHCVGNPIRRVHLIAPHHLQHPIGIVRNRIEPDHLMCHRDGQERAHNLIPVINRLVIKVRPMEIKRRIESAVRSRIGEVQRFFGSHSHKNLYQRKQSGEHPFVGVFLNLMARLTHRYSGSLQLDMNHRHSVNQQHYIPAAIVQNPILRRELRLLCNLINALASGNLHAVEQLQADFFSQMFCILRIIPNNRHASSIDETV